MKPLPGLLLVPFRAPMLLILLAVSTYLGLHWTQPLETVEPSASPLRTLIWSAECAQALVVVLFCCMPDLLVRRFTSLLATSRVITLVATLLLVTVGGLYLLHLEALSNVLILASVVLLARLDLARIRIAPAPPLLAALLALLVLGGAGLGHWLSLNWAASAPPGLPRSAEVDRSAEPGQAKQPAAAGEAPAGAEPARSAEAATAPGGAADTAAPVPAAAAAASGAVAAPASPQASAPSAGSQPLAGPTQARPGARKTPWRAPLLGRVREPAQRTAP
jgi:hypothetical protein